MDRSATDVEATPGQNETARVDVQVVPIQKRPLAPLFWSRMTSLFFAFAFLVVAGSLGAFFCFYILSIVLELFTQAVRPSCFAAQKRHSPLHFPSEQSSP
jgi:hypothetical protein